MSRPSTKLRALPYPAQITAIDEELVAGRGAALVRELCGFRDYQPLAYALSILAEDDALAALGEPLIPLLLGVPDTGLRRVLRALDEVSVPEPFIHDLARGAWQLPIERVAAVAMLDRWLKNTAPALRRAHVEEGLARCRGRLAAGDVEGIDDCHLMRVPGASLAALADVARHAGVAEGWQERQRRFAADVLDVLESQPKSLSQANAEELLSRQVYTDPGHFLIELLQNADDAGAHLWRVHIHDDRIEVEHDGTPFDALDVVGILSIGQTTKSKEQIGFFGVGFKSVYEICERPQVYSGVFSLEIADVSIPRPLRPLPDLAPERTRLVLPLRQARNEDLDPRWLFGKLAELPAQVVLTLNSVRELDLRHQGHRRHVIGRNEGEGRFRIDDGDRVRRYLVERDEAEYPGTRDAHRAGRTPVLVAVSLDDEGRPTPQRDGPSIYSYLPTHERSGLRVLVHAHFDLPVDRERLDLRSEWNRWALRCAGGLLRKAVERLCGECRPETGAALDAVLGVLSLPSELSHDSFEALAASLGDLEFLPGAGGNRLAAPAALICRDARLQSALADVELQDGRRLLRTLEARAQEVARWLGAVDLEIDAVVTCMADDAGARTSGAPFDPPWRSHMPVLLAALSEEPAQLLPLQDLPCLPDSKGQACCPRDLWRADAALRPFLGAVHPLIDEPLQSPGCAPFLDALGVPTARIRDLVELCAQPDRARQLIARVGAPALLDFLHQAPRGELHALPQAHIVPNDAGSLSTVGEIWLTGDSALARLVRAAPKRPPLVDADTEQALTGVLRSLECRTLGLGAVLGLLDEEHLVFSEDQLADLHRAIDAQARQLTPSLASRLARAPIFPVRGGGVAALEGDPSTNIPYDEDIVTLWPERSWIEASIARIPYVRTLGAAIVGPIDVAADLLSEAKGPQQRRTFFAYLARHPGQLEASVVERLAVAPLWPDRRGALRALDALRLPAQRPSVAALYEIWPRAMTIEEGESDGSARHLAHALGLSHRIATPDLTTAIADLRQSSAQAAAPFRNSGDLDMGDPAVAEIVAAVLIDAAQMVPRITLNALTEAPIYLCRDGERRRLGRFSEPHRGRALRVGAPLVPVFAGLGVDILAAEEATRLAPLLDALGLAPATLGDLVRCSATPAAAFSADSADRIRQALCTDVPGLAVMDQELRDAIATLPIWPTPDGLVVASEAVRADAVGELLDGTGIDIADTLGDRTLPLLAPVAETEARMLSSVVTFADPARLLAALVEEVAVVNAPLAEQSALLGGVDRVARLAVALAPHIDAPWSLPISVNAEGLLVARPLMAATEDELALCSGLALHPDLADLAWTQIILASTAPRPTSVSPRQVLAALREVSADSARPDQHACLHAEQARMALYRWLHEHATDIATDEQCRGLLGKSAVILSSQGVLRSPRELLFDDGLPDLGIDWNPSKEISEELCDWLRRCYRPASKQLRPIVDHMVEAMDGAADAGDGPRLAEIFAHLARLLRAGHDDGELEELARRFKLRKRLHVETEDGQFSLARKLLADEPLDADLVPRFAHTPPARASRLYRTPEMLRLLRAAGAEDELGTAALRSFLGGEGRREGSDATIAFACYLAGAAQRQPSLKHDLDLRRAGWLPDQLGSAHPPADLYWPSPECEALIGNAAHLYVHAELVLRRPDARTWLPLRTPEDAKLEDIAAHLAAQAARGIAASDDALYWLDAQIASHALDETAVDRALGDIPMFLDDHGHLRRAGELLVSGARRLFGHRRGNWSAGARLKHLTAALSIAKRPGKRDVLVFLEQIHREFQAHPERLQDESELLAALPACLDLLVEHGGRGPRHLPVTAQNGSQLVLTVLPAQNQNIALPGAEEDGDLILLLADGADLWAWQRYLQAYGVGPETVTEPVAPALPAPSAQSLPIRVSPKREKRDRASDHEVGHADEDNESDEEAGVLSRLRRWFRSEDEKRDEDEREDEEAQSAPSPRSPGSNTSRPPRGGAPASTRRDESTPPSPSPPVSPVDQRSWFRGERSLGPQLSSNAGWLADRMQVADFGLAHAPPQLPLPHRYAPVAIFADFDRRRQRWSPLAADPAWRAGGARAGRLHLRGKLPSPEAVIPLPLYGRYVGHRSSHEVSIVEGRDATVLLSQGDPTLSVTIELDSAPNFTNATPARAVKSMLATSVADRELPEEALDLVASLEREPSALQIAGSVCAFVKKRYAYDPSYLEDPQVAAWLQERSAGRSNTHIAALHAGADARHLGRGVCYELNALVCELLRRAGVPAAVATGWTFDRGHIDEPDHLWAMALLQTSEGPRWLPVDASTTARGRPLHAAHRPPGPWRADKRQARNVEAPPWDVQAAEHAPGDALPIGDLLRVARYLERATGRHLGTRGEILAACRDVLSDPQRSKRLADLLGEDEADS